jgi:hypothetical protein
MQIDFTTANYGNLALSALYLGKSVRHLWLAIADAFAWVHDRVIKRYPLACMGIVIVAATLISLVNIGKARAERDNVCRELYLANKKIDSLEIIK